MSAQHTSGPWSWVVGDDGEQSALRHRHPEGGGSYIITPESADGDLWLDVSPANASLIAAAPELLELAGDVRDLGEALADAYTDDEGADRLTLSDGTVLTGEAADAVHLILRTAIGLGEAARAAIAKATGQ